MSDPTVCAILLAAAAILALVGWGAWANVALRARQESRRQPLPADSVRMAPPVEAETYVPPADRGPSGTEEPKWVLERIMDERFEPVEVGSEKDDSDWL